MTEQEIIDKALDILGSRVLKSQFNATSVADVKSYLTLKYAELEYESFNVMFLNAQHELIYLEEMFRGTIDTASIYPREIVKTSLAFNAAAVILNHNHPSGHCQPSHADKMITSRIANTLSLVDVKVLDHIIVGGNNSYSFAEHGLL
jgi:DNA repair protein RadC